MTYTNKHIIKLSITLILLISGIISSAQPVITTQPAASIIAPYRGVANNLTVAATGSSLTYQWYRNTTQNNIGGTAIPGNRARAASYKPATSEVGTFYYYVVVSGTGGSATSNVSTIYVLDEGMTTAIACQNSTQSLNITQNPNLLYQWYSNTTASNTGGTAISGATNSTYNPPTTNTGTFYYYVVVNDGISPYTSKYYTFIVQDVSVNSACTDTDNDGIVNPSDLDADNDGILDADELYCDNPDLPVATTSGTGAYKTQLGFFDFTGKEWTTLGQTHSSTVVYNGITYTADVKYIYVQNWTRPSYSEDLTVGTPITKVSRFYGKDINTWAAGPPQMIHKLYNVNSKQEVICVDGHNELVGEAIFTIDVKAEKAGVPVPFQLVVFDAEASNFMEARNNWPEQIQFKSYGKGFQNLEKSGTGNYDDIVTVSGNGFTITVKKVDLSADNKTLTYNYTENNIPSNPSNVNGIFETIDYNSSRHIVEVIVKTNGGGQAFGFAVRTNCDTDSDGIPNFMDFDSDNDGCPDAIEGDENVTHEHLNPDGSINTTANGGIDPNGVPNLVNPGGAADIGNDIGQGIGTSLIASNISILTQPTNVQACTGSTATLSTLVSTSGTGNWTYQLQKYNGVTWYNIGSPINIPAGGNATVSIFNVTSADNGTYRLEFVGENNACHEYSNSATLTVYDMSTSLVVSDATCFNTSTGSLTVTVTGGFANYTYKLMDEHGNPYTANGYTQHTHTTTSTTHTFSNLPAGSYKITVSDANGCEREVCY